MLEVDINQIVTSPTSLRFGCVVRNGNHGPVRFAGSFMLARDLEVSTLVDLQVWAAKELQRRIDAERDERNPPDDPLF